VEELSVAMRGFAIDALVMVLIAAVILVAIALWFT
jgi:hypothetical protein